ncbi:hypothetical protein B5M09_011145 [Aphanomyces astaci]|uniref:Uncharacterized protein n=1 Tax=Aphanomyces astaci TaxID=112090 RepID=A0A425CQ47_APHAT|nr:hypothetical protein B5M09_011145 [Aphanomyces astaci]
MAKLKMDTTVQSTESRVSKLFSEFVAALVRHLMEGFAEAEPNLRAEPNLMVDYLVAAVQPLAARARVKELLKLNENRSLKKDVEPMMAAGIAAAKPDKLLTATKAPKAGKAPKVVAVMNVDKVPKSNFTQERCAPHVLVTKLKTPIKVKGFIGPAHTVTEEATMDQRFETDAGPLMLTNLKCWVSTGDCPPTSATSF